MLKMEMPISKSRMPRRSSAAVIELTTSGTRMAVGSSRRSTFPRRAGIRQQPHHAVLARRAEDAGEKQHEAEVGVEGHRRVVQVAHQRRQAVGRAGEHDERKKTRAAGQQLHDPGRAADGQDQQRAAEEHAVGRRYGRHPAGRMARADDRRVGKEKLIDPEVGGEDGLDVRKHAEKKSDEGQAEGKGTP